MSLRLLFLKSLRGGDGMLVSMFLSPFYWLPAPLVFLIYALFSFFFVFIFLRLVEFIIGLFKFGMDIFGGALRKVVTWFLG